MTLTQTSPSAPPAGADRLDAVDPVEAAAQALLAERATLEEWEARLAATRDDLAAADDGVGTALLAAPGLEVELAQRVAALQVQVGLTEKAIAAQQPRVLVAERQWLAAQADAHEQVVVAAQAALDEHQAKTRRLLAALEQHEGEYLARKDVIESQLGDGVVFTGSVTWKEPRSYALLRDLFSARLQVAALREMAAGRDPSALRADPQWHIPGCFASNQRPELYPACVKGPEALVQPAAHVRAVARLRAHVAELQDLARTLPVEIADWERRITAAKAAGELNPDGSPSSSFDGRGILNTGRGDHEPIVTPDGLARRCVRLESVDDELIEAQRALAELTGDDPAEV